MKCLSLFSGIGGFDLALTRLGHTIVGACEIDNYARLIYAKHFPEVTIHRDATKINPHNLPDFDLLVAGFPCQSFSVAGNRQGFKDSRGTLFFEIARIAKEKRPRYLLLENVKGILYHEGGKTIRKIFQILDELGYDSQTRIVNSKDFVPQNRERIFIIAYLRGECTREIFPLEESVQKTDKGMNMIIMNPGVGQHYRVYDDNGLSPTLGATNEDRNQKNTLVYISQKNSNMKQRIQERDTTWTLTNNSGDFGIKEGSRIRRLTPIECERLQGFPDNYTEGISDTQRYKCLGNAVTVPVVEHILENLY